jgi:hypothetical protein
MTFIYLLGANLLVCTILLYIRYRVDIHRNLFSIISIHTFVGFLLVLIFTWSKEFNHIWGEIFLWSVELTLFSLTNIVLFWGPFDRASDSENVPMAFFKFLKRNDIFLLALLIASPLFTLLILVLISASRG